MKKIVLSLLMLCTVLCAWSYETETVTITYGGTNTSPFTVSGTSSYEPSVGDYWLVRNGDNLELKANQGYYVTKVEFETNGYNNVEECDKLTQLGKAWVRGGDDTDYYDVVTFSNTESITKITSVTVTYYHVCYGATHHDAVSATCTTTGMDEYWECVCGKIYSNATCTNEVTNTESLELSIDPHNHNGNLEEVNEVLATCVSTGIMHHWHCTSCNHNYSDESGQNHIENDNVTTDIAPTNHVEKMQYFPSVAATCAAKGTQAHYYCTHCEKYYLNETDAEDVSLESLGTDIDPNNHNGQLKEVAYKNASCTEDGVYHHWHCDACGNDYADANATVDMNGKTVKPKYDADALLVSNSTIDDSYLLGDGAEVTFNTEGNIATLTIGSDSHQYEISESDPLSIEFSHTFKLTAIQDPNNTANYYATFYTSEGAYKLPEGVTAYTGVAGKSGENNVVVLTEIDNIIHKSEAVILRSNSANITLMPSSNKNAAASGNVLTGTDETKTLVTGDYALSSGSDGIGFYKWDNKSVAANSAYLNFGENKGDIFYLAHVVSYVTNVEGKTVPNDNVIIDNKIASEPSVTNEGYRIDGWYTESTFENEWDFANDVVTKDITLYAQWQQYLWYIGKTNPEDAWAILDDEGTLTIYGEGAIQDYEKKESPFYENETITEVVFDNASSITSIGNNLFRRCYALESITIPNSVTTIGESAFKDCINLTSITLPKNESFTTIATSTFHGCEKLQNITIPNSVTTIGTSAFDACFSLTNITIPNSVATIAETAFMNCKNLSNITLPENELFTKLEWGTFFGCGKLSNITIPNSVTIIDEYAFFNCAKLNNITIPSSVTTIGLYAFVGCTSFTELTIPSSVTTIGSIIIARCGENLKTVVFEGTPTTIDGDAFGQISETPTTPTLLLPNNWSGEAYVNNETPWYGGLFNLAHVVSYNTNSTETVSNDTIFHNEKLTAPTVSKTGYKFLGWFTEDSFTNEWDFANNVVTKNITLYAQWIQQFTVAFVTNGAAETIESQTIDINEKVEEPTVSKTGYRLVGWFTEDSFTNEWDFANDVVTKNITLYAKWIQQFTVAFVTNGAAETIETQTIDINEKVEKPTVSKAGYKFLGWFTEDTFTNEWDFANDVVTKNITLYAQWIQQFTVAFVTNGAAETIASQTIDINEKVEKPTVSKTGYRLDGWYTENTFTNKWDFDNDVLTQNITLYAQWIQQFTVTFEPNGAAETIESQTIDIKQKVTEPTVSKTGYRLDGWYTENTFTNKWDFDNDVLTQNTTLYAKWIQQFTVAFEPNGATETIESQTIDINEKVTKPSVSKTGYKFLGWYTEDSFTNKWDFANDKVTKDITLYAQWLQQFTVEFVTNGAAETIESQTIDINEKVEKPTVSKAGYKFLGWFTESTFENQWDFANDKVTKDITLYAQWIQQFTVEFVTNGAAETIESQTIDNNQKVTEPSVSKTGCELRGWYTESTFENKWNFASNVVTANTTLYALWHQHVGVAQSLAATCENDGYAEHFVCECGKAFTTIDCTTEITDLAAWKVGEGKIPAIGHDYVKGDWKWAEDYSEATLEFVCQNDHSHIIPVDADITSKTIKQTCSADGKITYFASALYDGEEYKTTADSIIPAAHIYVVKKWAWSDDFKSCTAKFVCQRDIQHTANVEAVVTTSTNEDNQPIYIATATIDGVEYTDTIIGNIYYVGKTNLQDAWAMVGEDGTLTFYGEGDMMDFDETTPPYSAIRNAIKQVVFDENANITSIGKYAFEMCENLTSITIPNMVETIGAFAFAGCSNLKTTTLPEQLTAIEPFTFIDCYYLSNVTIPDGVTTIGKSAFSSCEELKNIIIPNSVTAIEDSAFWNCSDLKTITLSENLTTIAPHTFEWCESLSNITIPDGVTAIEDSAFYNCEMLESIIIPNSVTTIGERAFNGCSELKAITLPEKLTAIAPSTFEGCGFTSITIPNGVTTIGEAAFAVCRSLTSITIPNSLTTIENEVFAACEKLADITIPSSVTTIGSGILEYCFCGSVTFEGTPTTIAEDAFKEISIKPVLTLPEVGWTGEQYVDDETLWYGGYFINEIENKIFIGKENPEDAWAEIDENGTLTIFGTGETQDYNYEQGSENSPFLGRSNIKNIVFDANSNITALGSGTFMYCPNLTNATIPNTVTSIGASAFAKSNIATITLPDNLTEIDSLTFEECKNLTDVTIPSKVETIGYRAFYGCKSFEDITVPNSVTFIDDGAFLDCKNLKKITLSENIDRIEQYTFLGCESLESITIPSKVTSIGEEAFAYCFNLKSIILPNGLANISRIAFHQCISLESLTIPATVTSVGEKIFGAYYKYDKGNFESLRFLGTPDNIDDNAFNDVNGDMGQSSPIDLYLPFDWSGEEWVDNKTPWYGGYFNLVKEDPTFYIGKDNPEDAWAVWEEDGTFTIYGTGATIDYYDEGWNWTEPAYSVIADRIKNVVFDESSNITSIGSGMFETFENLESIAIPNSVTSIGNNAFYDCESLESITIPSSVTTIGNDILANTNVTKVIFEGTPTTIAENAFEGISSTPYPLLILPSDWSGALYVDKDTKWYGGYFYNEIEKKFYIGKENPEDAWAILDEDGTFTIYGEGATQDYYDADWNWTEPAYYGIADRIRNVVFDESSHITSLGSGMFSDCKNLESITIPNTVTSIGEGAFASCYALTNITLPEDLTEISEGAFGGCYALTNIILPEALTKISDYAFEECESLESIIIPNSVTSIGESAFGYCYALTNITLSEGLTKISDYAFESCESLESIIIPNSVTSIGESAFGYCYALTNITLSEGLTEISDGAFYGCGSLESISIPSSVKTIGKWILGGCSDLQSVTFEGSPERIDIVAFVEFNDSDTPIDLYLPDNWDGAPYIDSKTSWYGGYFNSTPTSICKFYIGKDNPKDAWAVLDQDGTFTIYGEGATQDYYDAYWNWTEPAYYCVIDRIKNVVFDESSNITSLGNGMFLKFDNIKTITIPNSVTSIGVGTFEKCLSLKTITIPNSVTSIGEGAFGDCYALTNITLSEGLTEISDGAFYGCESLESISFPSSVKTIGTWIVEDCYGLQSVTFETMPERIDMDAFRGFNDSDHPIDLYLPDNWDGVPYIDSETEWYGGYFNSTPASICKFYIGKDNPKDAWAIWDEDGTFTIYGTGATQDYYDEDWNWAEPTYYCVSEKIKNVVFDESSNISSIGSGMFEDCENLESITIPNSVTSIGVDAFYYCENIESITIPNTVTSIGESAFGGCYELTNITLPEGLTEIAPYTFYYCKNLESIIISNSVTTIGEYAFESCQSLKNITIPSKVTTIGENILERAICGIVSFEGTPTTISSDAFKNMLNEPFLTLPDDWSGKPYVDENTPWYGGYFYSELPTVFYLGKNNPEDAWAELSDDGTLTIYGHGETQDWNENSPFMTISTLITKVVFDDDAEITSLGQRMFDGCRNIETITIPNCVETIGVSAFAGCEKLTSITLPEKLTNISNRMFNNCKNLTDVTIPNNVTTISDFAFCECNSLESIAIPNNVTTIGEAAFAACLGLTDIVIPNRVTTIGQSAFAYCEKLTSITLPENLTEISNNMFRSCKNLTDVTIPNGVTTIGEHAFDSCFSLSNITIPNSVKSIEYCAFDDCAIKDITIPSSVTFIGGRIFAYCSAVESVTFEGTPTLIDFTAFGDMKTVPLLVLPDNWSREPYVDKNTKWYGGYFNLSRVFYIGKEHPEDVWAVFNGEDSTFTIYGEGEMMDFDEDEPPYHDFIEDNVKHVVFDETANVTNIGNEAFVHCYYLESVTIPNSVTTIGNYAFQKCYNLKDITIPSSVTTIGNNILEESHLSKVTFEGTPTTISENAFVNMETTPVLTLPDGWTGKPYVNEKTLWYGGYFYSELPTFYIGKEKPEDVWAVFNEEDSTFTIYGEGEMMDFDEDYPPYYYFIYDKVKQIVFDETANVTNIGMWAFGELSVESVTIPNSVTTIGNGAFAACQSLESITIPNSVTTIGEGAFAYCVSLESITIPNSVTTIGDEAFYVCKSLESITIPSSVTTIGEEVLYECYDLQSVTFEGTPESIHENAFTYINYSDPIDLYLPEVWGGEPYISPTRPWYGGFFNMKQAPTKFYLGKEHPEDVVATLAADGTLTITGSGEMQDYVDDSDIAFSPLLIVHNKIQQVVFDEAATVKSIGGGVFAECDGIENIIISSSVETIGDYAFALCDSLESITIPGSVTTIGDHILYKCSDLQSVTFEGTPESIDVDAFSVLNNSNNPIDLNLPEVWGGKLYESPEIPWYGGYFNLKQTPTKFFIGKEHPEDVVATLAADGTLTITGSGEMKDVDSKDMPASHPFFMASDKIKQVVFDENSNVTSIGDGMFEICENLESITIPNSVISIGEAAFNGCESLTNVTLPENLTEISNYAFEDCTSLKSITIPSGVTTIGDEAFADCESLESITIPNGVTTIGGAAFAECSGLESITIPSSVITIGGGAFYRCYSLTNVTLPETITEISDYAFALCSSLESITIPSGVTTIGDNAFNSCGSLESITIPSSVTTIGNNILEDSYLTKVTFEGTPTTIAETAFESISTTPRLVLPSDWSGEPYVDKDTEWYGGYFDNEPEKVFYIGKENPEDAWAFLSDDGTLTIFGHGETADYYDYESPFSGNYAITNVVFDEDAEILSLGNNLFDSCPTLKSITIPNTVTTIGGYTFVSCYKLKDVTIPNTVTSIGEGAFHTCYALTNVTLPETLSEIPYSAFYYCESLESITIPSGVTIIGESAFEGCYGLTSITIPSSVTTIGERIVTTPNGSNLQSVTFEGTPKNIDPNAFVLEDNQTEPVPLFLPNNWYGEEYIDNETPWYGGLFNLMRIVVYNTNGGSEIANDTIINDSKLVAPTAPTKAMSQFEGWYKDEALASAWNFDHDVVTKNITLYAKWHLHNPVEDELLATCETDGYKKHYVCECGKAFTTDDCTTEITDLAAWKAGDGLIPALNHDYELSEWNWADDNSAASATFVCKNDETHVETVNAIVTTDTVKATCTEKGLVTYNAVATFNGEEYKDVATTELPVLNHDYAFSKWNWADDKSEASAIFVCKNDETHVETVAATITTNTVDATCTEDGLITYNAVATFNGEEYKDVATTEIPAINHDYAFSEWTWSDDKSEASAIFICNNDETHVETVAATITTTTVEATCTEDGKITYNAVATFQGEEYKDEVTTELPALNHDYALSKWNWAEDNKTASVSFACKNDETHVETVTATVTIDTVKATVDKNGKITYTATAEFQGETYTDTKEDIIPALGHEFVFGEWLWSDDKKACSAVFKCINEENHTETVDAKVTADTLKATCLADGLITSYAVTTFNSKDYKDTVKTTLPALNHDYALGKWTWNEDNSEASVSFVCKNDNSHVETVDAVITTDTVEATCTEKGLITYNAVATFNGEEYKDVATTEIPALNHDYALGKWTWNEDNSEASVSFVCKNDETHVENVDAVITTDTIKATCTEKGLITYNAVATFNGEEYKDVATTEIPALNHDYALGKWTWKDDNSESSVSFVCKNDETHVENVDATVTTDTVKATVDKNGKITYTATAEFQGETYTDTKEDIIPALGHEFVFGEWLWSDDKKACSAVFKCINEENHTETVDAKVTADTLKATCLADGLITSYAVATFNSKDYKDTVKTTLPALNHDYALGKWTWKDDNSEASVSFVCKNDNSHVENVDAVITTDTIKATCTEKGLITYNAVATFNGEEYKDVATTEIPALNHDYALDKWTWKDDNSEASVSFVCKNDNSHVENVDAVITTDTVKATCTEKGLITYNAVATFNGEEYKDVATTEIPALNHDYALGKWTWNEDNSEASVSFVCKNDETHVETVDAVITTDTVKATCTEKGLITYNAVATFNGEEYKDVATTEIPALNHDYAFSKWNWADDNSEASATFVCKNDESHVETVAATITTNTVEATCTEKGLITYNAVATFNGEEYKDVATTEIPALNHNFALNKWLWSDDKSTAKAVFTCKNDSKHADTVVATITTDTVKATVDKNGKITYTATAEFDGETYTDTKEDIIPAIGHEFVFGKWLWADDKKACAAVFNCINEENHADTVDAKVTADTLKATCLVDGLITSYAVATFNGEDYKDTVKTTLPALNHDYALGKWTWNEDNSEASVSFVCKNDNKHVENVDATITTDTVKATCTEDGLISYYAVATFQSEEYKDTVETILPAINHDFALDKWLWSDDKSTAEVAFICKNDSNHADTVVATITTDTVKATCTEKGLITYNAVATFQGEEYKDEATADIPALNHDYALGEWTWSNDYKTASVTFICKNDETHVETVDATITSDTVEATCTEKGLITYNAVATFQGEEYKDEATADIPALNHDYALSKWNWAEDNKTASVTFVCKNDETHVETVDAEITTDTVKATCTEDGTISYFAVATFQETEYKDTATVTIPAINHDYALGEWTWSNDYKTASVSFICKNDETHVETVDAEITTDTVKATCTEEGLVSYYAVATFQSEEYKDTATATIPAINHDFALDKWLWSDDKSTAEVVFTCRNDNRHADTVNAVVTSDTTAATADKNGKIVYTAIAEFDGETYTDTKEDIIPAIGHEFVFGKWLWADDKKACAAVFNCINEENHADTIDAKVTADTLKATCLADGLITSYAVATFNGKDYKDTVTTVLPALNHDYALGKWNWKDDNSEASVSFVCKNDNSHVENVDATITTDTVKATCTEDGKISYFAVATFQTEEYKDTVETVLPAINHDFALDKWLWSDDKSTAQAAFICKNDSNHADTVVATITTDTIKATCTEDGLISYYAVATFQSEEYKDTVSTVLPAINHDYALGEWTWSNDNSEASVSFVCKNDETHVENVDAVITTDTVKVTCTTDGKISYFAVATFNGNDYKDTVVTTVPALNHDYALGKWTWNEDNSEASVSFICKNDETHVENIDAVITTDTVAATTDKNGKITYTATAEFDGKTYTDTKEDIIPAIGHEFVFGKWLWADDKASCAAVFNCINEENHADTIDAKVTADTLKATCLADGLITSYAVATFNGKDYKDTVTTVLPALNHDYALGEWTWKDDNSAASVSFICNNDETHVENVDATITTDTVKATCENDGLISYFAVATFQGVDYKDTVTATIPATGHSYAFGSWLWSDDKSQCSAVFVCANDKQHTDTVSAVVTSDTTAATLTENGKIVFVADVTYEEKNYSDTVEVVLYPSLAYADIIGLIQGTYCLTTYSGDEANRPAKDLYFKFYGTDTLTQGHFNDLNYKNINADDLSNIAVHNNRVTFDYKPNTTFSFSLDTALNTCTKVTVKNSALNQTCILTKTDTEEVDIADIWNIIEGSYINELGKVQNFIMEPDSETGKDIPCFMWVDQFDGDEGFENIDGYFPLAGDESVRIEKTGNYYDFMVSGDKYFTLTIENDVVTGFMTYGYDDEDVFKGNYKKLAYSDILEDVQGIYNLTAVNGEPKTGNVQVEFEDEEFIIIRNGKTEQKTLVENISQIMYTSDSIAVIFKDNSMFSFNVDNDTITKVTLISGDNVLEFAPDKLVPEAVDELTDNIKVFVRNNEIVVSGLSHDDVVTIYTVNGKLLYKQEQTVETASYEIYVGGIYFVKVGNKTYTVLY